VLIWQDCGYFVKWLIKAIKIFFHQGLFLDYHHHKLSTAMITGMSHQRPAIGTLF
jgi:hypothetical protein